MTTYEDCNGYLRVKKQLVHRIVCRQAHGEYPSCWHVHHVNGKKQDNRPENLIALPPRLHRFIHVVHELDALPERQQLERWVEEEGDRSARRAMRKRLLAVKRARRKEELRAWWERAAARLQVAPAVEKKIFKPVTITRKRDGTEQRRTQ